MMIVGPLLLEIWNHSVLFNDTADLDDDFDGVYDHWDIDDDNDGIWDYFEIDSNDDLDDDSGTLPPGNFYLGSNCEDNDDDGTDTDPDQDGFFQAVHDKGVLGQGLLESLNIMMLIMTMMGSPMEKTQMMTTMGY